MPVAGVVGRDREMAAVGAFLDALPSGPCGLVLEGAAGIGKTTVWRAGVAQAAERSYTAVDDLHWLDEPSARVLEFALRRLSGEPAGLLASARDREDEGQVPAANAGPPAAARTPR